MGSEIKQEKLGREISERRERGGGQRNGVWLRRALDTRYVITPRSATPAAEQPRERRERERGRGKKRRGAGKRESEKERGQGEGERV